MDAKRNLVMDDYFQLQSLKTCPVKLKNGLPTTYRIQKNGVLKQTHNQQRHILTKGIDCFNEKCARNEDCVITEKTVCSDNICQCNRLSYFSESQSKCLKYVTEFDGICYEKEQCLEWIGQNSKCNKNRCSCEDGYRWFQGKCQKYVTRGESCKTSADCFDEVDPLALTCSWWKCECSSDYYDRGPDCRFKSSYGGDCAINLDCKPKTIFFFWKIESHCELGICEKNPDHKTTILSHADEKGIRPKEDFIGNLDYFINNTAEKNCTNVSLSLSEPECLKCPNTRYFMNSTCICSQGFFLKNDLCIPEIGMKDPKVVYKTEKECPIKPAKVKDGICYCKNYWSVDMTNRECKKTTLEKTLSCMDNDWCKAMGPYAYCDSSTSTCQCVQSTLFKETLFYCEKADGANFTGICLKDTDCSIYQQCRDQKCQCVDGFSKLNDTADCLPGIGSSCEFWDCSHIENAECSKDELCQCSSDKFVTDGLICVKTAELHEECLLQQQCDHIPHAVCQKNATSSVGSSTCRCDAEYTDVNGTCYQSKSYGSPCSSRFNCTVVLNDSFECRNGICQCPVTQSLNGDYCAVSSGRSVGLNATLLTLVVVFLWVRAFRFE